MDTAGSTFIHRLYHGTIVNSIVCKECGNVSQRQVCAGFNTATLACSLNTGEVHFFVYGSQKKTDTNGVLHVEFILLLNV